MPKIFKLKSKLILWQFFGKKILINILINIKSITSQKSIN